MIEVKNLSKTFKVYRKEPGLKGSLKSLFKRDFFEKLAISDVSLKIDQGEIIGLVGANGAGKTTLVKILSGIIFPTSGDVSVLGFDPWKRENEYRRKLSLIMGQKAQLWWDLPAYDSFLLLKEIYEISNQRFQENIEKLSKQLDIADQLKVPVRKLSLGERMKTELMAALLHDPQVIFLDEPTIGLDIMSQKAVRSFLQDYRKEHKPIIILTSHYMEDIEELCPRLALIKDGSIIYDGSIETITNNYAQFKTLEIDFQDADENKIRSFFEEKFSKLKKEIIGPKLKLQVERHEMGEVMKVILDQFNPKNLNITEVDISIVIENYLVHEKSI